MPIEGAAPAPGQTLYMRNSVQLRRILYCFRAVACTDLCIVIVKAFTEAIFSVHWAAGCMLLPEYQSSLCRQLV